MKPSTRSERPQSSSWRSGSTPARCSRSSGAGSSAAPARLALALGQCRALGFRHPAIVASPRRGLRSRARMRSKDEVRREVWEAMEREGVARFPGAEGRIPNFGAPRPPPSGCRGIRAGSSARDDQGQPGLAPDARAPARARAGQDARDGRAAAARPAPVPAARPAPGCPGGELREAATIKGALRYGTVIDLDQVPPLDLVLTGSVASTSRAPGSARAAASRTSSSRCCARPVASTGTRSWRRPCIRCRSCARTCS